MRYREGGRGGVGGRDGVGGREKERARGRGVLGTEGEREAYI